MFEKIGPDVAGHITFTIVALSFMVKDILWLRTLSITASCFSFIYNYFGPAQPMWVAISWNCFFISLNIYHITRILKERRGVELSAIEEEIHNKLFRSLSKMDFHRLLTHAKWVTKSPSEVLIAEGEKVENLIMIYRGKVGITLHQKRIAELEKMQFIGELSFLSQKPASATVHVEQECRLLVWDQEDLRHMMQKSPALLAALQGVIGLQISEEVSRQNEKLAA